MIRDRQPCAYCDRQRRKPLPLGPVAGLPTETAGLLICRPCRAEIRQIVVAYRVMRVRLVMAVEDGAAPANRVGE